LRRAHRTHFARIHDGQRRHLKFFPRAVAASNFSALMFFA
jgi:hypothetical protein